jgi:hypothetical protein
LNGRSRAGGDAVRLPRSGARPRVGGCGLPDCGIGLLTDEVLVGVPGGVADQRDGENEADE